MPKEPSMCLERRKRGQKKKKKKMPELSEEEKVLVRAFKILGLRWQRDPESWEPLILDRRGRKYEAYTAELWLDCGVSTAEDLGEAESFMCDFGWKSEFVENPFYGIKCLEELELKLALLGK